MTTDGDARAAVIKTRLSRAGLEINNVTHVKNTSKYILFFKIRNTASIERIRTIFPEIADIEQQFPNAREIYNLTLRNRAF